MGIEFPTRLFERLVCIQALKTRLQYVMMRMNTKQIDDAIVRKLTDAGYNLAQDTNELYLDVQEAWGMEPGDFLAMPVTDMAQSGEADIVLSLWAKEQGDLTVESMETYSSNGHKISPSFSICMGRQIPNVVSCLCRYQGTYCYLHMVLDARLNHWNATARGQLGAELLVALDKRADKYFVDTYRGQCLDHNGRPIKLKLYKREDLVYPPALGKKIDIFIKSFLGWYSSDSVRQWGGLFEGPPGTGKTTIGGLIAGCRPEGCTFIYCSAKDIDQPYQLEAVFALAKRLEPAVIHIDDVDMLAQSRDDFRGVPLTKTLMELLDGLEEGSKLFINFTSNNTSGMEHAITFRAGRLSDKIVFGGFGECLGALLRLGRDRYSLSFKHDLTISNAIAKLPAEARELTPDEAINVAKRLHLCCGSEAIDQDVLREAIEEVATAFHMPAQEEENNMK